MGAGASSHNNKPEVHVVVVQQQPVREDNHSSSNVAADNSNVDNEIIHTALKAVKLDDPKETRYVHNSYSCLCNSIFFITTIYIIYT